MAVAIRLTRVGATKRPAYRVIAIDKRRSRDGRALEILGYYDPLTEPATVRLETDKIKAWIGKGAQPSDTVVRLMRQAEATAQAGADAPAPKRATRAASAKAIAQGRRQGQGRRPLRRRHRPRRRLPPPRRRSRRRPRLRLPPRRRPLPRPLRTSARS